jgi:hypothetical protein
MYGLPYTRARVRTHPHLLLGVHSFILHFICDPPSPLFNVATCVPDPNVHVSRLGILCVPGENVAHNTICARKKRRPNDFEYEYSSSRV